MAELKEDILEKHKKVYELLKKVRESKTVSLKPTSMLRSEIVGLDGTLQPFRLRYYQVQAIFHLLSMKRMVLGDAAGTGKCVIGDTLLLTNEGFQLIRDLIPDIDLTDDTFYELNKPVKVWTGTVWTPVRRFYWNGVTETRHITTKSGFEVEGSLAHPLKIRSEDGVETFRKLSDLKGDAYLCIHRNPAPFPNVEPFINFTPPSPKPQIIVYPCPKSLTPDLARLLGYVVAEACTTVKGATNIFQYKDTNPEVHDDIRSLLYTIFNWSGNINNKDRDQSILVSSVYIKKYLECCGITNVTAHYKVPSIIFKGTRTSVIQFLKGVFEGEAYTDKHDAVEFSTSSSKLSRDIQLLLLHLGIISSRAPRHIKKYSHHTYWKISLYGENAILFHDMIGFISPRKQQALKQISHKARNPNRDVVPYLAEDVKSLKQALLISVSKTGANENRKGSGLEQFGRTFVSTLTNIILGYRNPTYAFLKKLLDFSKVNGLEKHPAYFSISNIIDNHYFYDSIKHIAGSEASTMDIEVEHEDHCFTGNGFINHNTIVAIASLCYTWEKEPTNKAIILVPKSALRQWKAEIERFSTGIKVFFVNGSSLERRKTYNIFKAHPTGEGYEKAVMLMNYAPLIRDWNEGAIRPLKPDGQPNMKAPLSPGLLNKITSEIPNLTIVADECTAFKNNTTKTWQVCRELSERANRCYGLTATLLKNNLIEGFSIYKCIYPDVFSTKTNFLELFCVTRLQPVGGGRKIPIIVGYRNLQLFRDRIDPFFLGRAKHLISDELPKLITKEVIVELSAAEDLKYQEALTGILSLGSGEVKNYEEYKHFVALTYCQQTVDSLSLLGYEGGESINTDMFQDEFAEVNKIGSKEQTFLDLLTSEFDDEKVIVYTRFASLIPRLQNLCKSIKIQSVAITGKIVDTKNNPARQKAMQAFQDLKSKIRVIFISDAGSEAINLQAASAMIFFDAPWSWGNYVQLLGRPIRIGSPHQHVVAVHLVAERPGTKTKERKTIDRYTLEILQRKKNLIDKVLGESAVGALDFEAGSFTHELLNKLRSDGSKHTPSV